MKKLSNTDAELKKTVAFKKTRLRKIRHVCKNLLNLHCKDSIPFYYGVNSMFLHNSSCLKMKNPLGRVSPSPFPQNVLIQT